MAITIEGLSRRKPADPDTDASRYLFRGVSFRVDAGCTLAVFGPNGVGKTTLLRVVAGLASCDEGSVNVVGPPDRGRLGYVFQDFSATLLPWLTGGQHIRLAASYRSEQDYESVISHLAAGLSFPSDRFPYKMSSGEQQKLSLLRTLVQRPANLLLDEPFSALDLRARHYLQTALPTWLRGQQTATVLITHDLDEAILMSDRVMVLGPDGGGAIAEANVEFPYPRVQTLRSDPAFLGIRTGLVEGLLEYSEP
jgi:NitT/TauT family transport system ATP-binding protein